jgi:hypothetical protein
MDVIDDAALIGVSMRALAQFSSASRTIRMRVADFVYAHDDEARPVGLGHADYSANICKHLG